jgi:hypothetical protein
MTQVYEAGMTMPQQIGMSSFSLCLITMLITAVRFMLTQAGLKPEDSDVIDYLEAIKRNMAEA